MLGDPTSHVLTLILGVASGLVTLVGLLSIFISINSQQLIGKAREILWDMQSLSEYGGDVRNGSFLRKFRRNIHLYAGIVQSHDENNIIFGAWVALFASLLIWLYAGWDVYIQDEWWLPRAEVLGIIGVLFIAVVVLAIFAILLHRLGRFERASRLPTTDQLLDVHTEKLNVLQLATRMARAYFMSIDDAPAMPVFSVMIGLPLEFAFQHLFASIGTATDRIVADRDKVELSGMGKRITVCSIAEEPGSPLLNLVERTQYVWWEIPSLLVDNKGEDMLIAWIDFADDKDLSIVRVYFSHPKADGLWTAAKLDEPEQSDPLFPEQFRTLKSHGPSLGVRP